MSIWVYLILAVVINILFFIPAFKWQTDRLTDATYSITFITLSLVCLIVNGFSLVNSLLFAMVLVWALRLGGFLVLRINKIKKDHRFDEIRGTWYRFIKFWLIQAVAAWVVLLPLFFVMPLEGSSIGWVGVVIWALGIVIEAVADQQKYIFKKNPDNRGEFIKHGIWRYSRHPNYFGEILCWIGVYVAVVHNLTLLQGIIAGLSPLSITCALLFLTGIPPLEKSAEQKWGDDPQYQEYKKRTSILIPWFPLGGKVNDDN